MMTGLQDVLRVAREELNLDARRICVRLISSVLPQHSFLRLRTALLRALGLRIGVATGFAGSVKITGAGSLQELLWIGSGCPITGPLHIDLVAPARIRARRYLRDEVMRVHPDP